MSNGHKPGIEFHAESATVLADGVAFKCGEEDVKRIAEYFAEYNSPSFSVSATVVGDAGSTGDIPEAPASGS